MLPSVGFNEQLLNQVERRIVQRRAVLDGEQCDRRKAVKLVGAASQPAERTRDEEVDDRVRTGHGHVLHGAEAHVEKVLEYIGVIGAEDKRVEELDNV